jgi:hypothetical protein
VNRNQFTRRTERYKFRKYNEGIDQYNRGSYYGGWSIKNNPTYSSRMGLIPESSGMGDLPSQLSWFLFSSLGASIHKQLEEGQHMLPLTRIAVEAGYRAVIEYLLRYRIITEQDALGVVFPPIDVPIQLHQEKDAYADTWSFSDWTPAAIQSGVRDITENAACQVLRSRVAWLRGMFRDYRISPEESDKWAWHSDEPIVHNTRVIVPLQTTSAYAMEIGDNGPKVPEKGYAYTWDTNIVHRQLQVDNADKSDRIYLILGFNPWFNWLPEEQAWESNEFYGKVHPMDMMTGGLIMPNLKFDKVIE